MVKLWVYGAAAAGIAAVSAWGAYSLGHANGKAESDTKASAVIAAKNAKIDALTASDTQCRAANSQYLVAIADDTKRINAELAANAQRTATAAIQNAQANKQLLDANARTAQSAALAREAIQRATEECLHQQLGADYVSMLNGIRTGSLGGPARPDAVPTLAADH